MTSADTLIKEGREEAPRTPGDPILAYDHICQARALVIDALPPVEPHWKEDADPQRTRFALEHIIGLLPLDVATEDTLDLPLQAGIADVAHVPSIKDSRHPTVELDELGRHLAQAMEEIRAVFYSPKLTAEARVNLAVAYVHAAQAQVAKADCLLPPFIFPDEL